MYFTMKSYKISGNRLTLISTAETNSIEGYKDDPPAKLVERIKEAFSRRTRVQFRLNEAKEGSSKGGDLFDPVIRAVKINDMPVYTS